MPDPPARAHQPSLLLAGALALSALVTTLATHACGGNVVVDGSSTAAGGGSGGSTALTTTTTGGGSGGAGGAGGGFGGSGGSGNGGAGGGGSNDCTVVTSMPGYMVSLACVPGGDCPAADTMGAKDLVSQALGLCDLSTNTCCLSDVFVKILCGPSPSDGDCCYVALTSTHTCG
jgi:hypothetical protein